MRYLITLACLLGLANTTVLAAEDDASWFERSWNSVAETYTKGSSELYVPARTYHLRSAYSREKIDSYQENPHGLGYGRGHYDDKGNWSGVYAMGFQDSHFKPEWMVGYSWKAMWGDPSSWHTGLGYTAFLTTRADIGRYTPVPGLLPVASVGY
ncbi:MAG TPA: lipid IV(A) palmitoyltransferase PagP, partial [Rhodocyclaceae bacterium]|nr:lipid IV(A) palmitoyltransferase PagP [Rhodocyclaceae bacterium]